MTPYGDIDLGQHQFRKWLNPDSWRHQAISIFIHPYPFLDQGAVCVPFYRVGSSRSCRTPALRASVLWVNASQATITDIGLHTFRPCPPRPSLLCSAENRKVCDRFYKGHGPLHNLNQCWLIICEVLWHSPGSNFILRAQPVIPHYEFKICFLNHCCISQGPMN